MTQPKKPTETKAATIRRLLSRKTGVDLAAAFGTRSAQQGAGRLIRTSFD